MFISIYVQAQIETDTTQKVEKGNSGSESITVISIAELDGDEESADISGILQSSRDVFVSKAAYTFGPARFRIRGYDSENSSVMMNGVSLNDMESGRVYWSSWGGLNDALRNSEILNGITESQFSYGGIGGATNMEVRASSYSPTVKLTVSSLNRSYNQRLMFTYATGLMQNGWAITFSGSKRWAQEGYVEGSSYDAYAYFLSVEKKLNNKHSIGFIGYGAPSKRGKSSAVVQEAYDLAGTNYYNPNWGYQNGEIRNARVSNYHKPMFMLSHYWTIDDDTKLTTTASYMFGRGGGTALNWFSGNDPRPDYYKNLPSLYEDTNPDYAQYLRDDWANNVNRRQLNWDEFYQANADEYSVIENANGIEGNTYSGIRSNFMVEDRRNDSKKLNLTSTFNSRISDDVKLTAGVDLTNYKGDRYTVVDDLLGGEFYLDINKFVDRDFADPSMAQNDLNNPNRIVKEGDIFGYHYTANINKYMGWGQLSFEKPKDSYLSSRTRDEVVKDLTNEKIFSLDGNYVMNYPGFKLRLSAYYTLLMDRTWNRSFYDESLREFVSFTMTGLDQRNMGIEFGIEKEILTGLKINAVAAIGEYIYNSRAESVTTLDNIRKPLREQTVYLKNYYIGGMPQTALSAGMNYRTPFFMFIGFDINYFDRNYLPLNPDRRTEDAVAGIAPTHPDYDKVLDQERLPSAFTLDANIGKSWRIDYKYYININLSVSNILNNQDLVTGGYEQYRFTGSDIDKFGNKYYYMYGTTYYLNLSFRF